MMFASRCLKEGSSKLRVIAEESSTTGRHLANEPATLQRTNVRWSSPLSKQSRYHLVLTLHGRIEQSCPPERITAIGILITIAASQSCFDLVCQACR